MKKTYAIAGSWGFGFDPQGISTYEYHSDSGELLHAETIMESICATQLSLDEERGIVYAVDSKEEQGEEMAGGGYVLAFRIDPEKGTLQLINKKRSMGAVPEYLCMDIERKYLIVAHHASSRHITRIVESKDGNFCSEIWYDDAPLVLFRIQEDGSIGEVCDISIPALYVGQQNKNSHLHFVMHNPEGNFYVVCDKGLDQVYTYGLDKDNGKLIFLNAIEDEKGSFPRYAAFHPRLPLVYINHERNAEVNTYLYNVESGRMVKLAFASFLFDWMIKKGDVFIEAADLVIHPNGAYLYASVRGVDIVAVMQIDSCGGLQLKQNIDCGGESPRGLCISPDGNYLFVLNAVSQNIVTFAIEKDGKLCMTPYAVHANMSSCMKMFAGNLEEKEEPICLF